MLIGLFPPGDLLNGPERSEKRLLLGTSRLIFSLASEVVVVSRSPSTISTGARIEPMVVLYDADRLTKEA
jgi:hypothetical protein